MEKGLYGTHVGILCTLCSIDTSLTRDILDSWKREEQLGMVEIGFGFNRYPIREGIWKGIDNIEDR